MAMALFHVLTTSFHLEGVRTGVAPSNMSWGDLHICRPAPHAGRHTCALATMQLAVHHDPDRARLLSSFMSYTLVLI